MGEGVREGRGQGTLACPNVLPGSLGVLTPGWGGRLPSLSSSAFALGAASAVVSDLSTAAASADVAGSAAVLGADGEDDDRAKVGPTGNGLSSSRSSSTRSSDGLAGSGAAAARGRLKDGAFAFSDGSPLPATAPVVLLVVLLPPNLIGPAVSPVLAGLGVVELLLLLLLLPNLIGPAVSPASATLNAADAGVPFVLAAPPPNLIGPAVSPASANLNVMLPSALAAAADGAAAGAGAGDCADGLAPALSGC